MNIQKSEGCETPNRAFPRFWLCESPDFKSDINFCLSEGWEILVLWMEHTRRSVRRQTFRPRNAKTRIWDTNG
jgi:hypothetical protein